ncbi:hypothetical protein PoB_006517600 [Plakobranchus ocellatus]|uniref:Uncharacterized protein n=1 Tax=Plakobranchus ocellatus TaxID=259542 RepID=A0AAV4D3V6_9GAST|nr:hypothetical protein PoB_006517600 [Plakobranchus ocellatus]
MTNRPRTMIIAKRKRAGGTGTQWASPLDTDKNGTHPRRGVSPWVSVHMVTTEKEGGAKSDGLTNREPPRLHLKDSFITTVMKETRCDCATSI